MGNEMPCQLPSIIAKEIKNQRTMNLLEYQINFGLVWTAASIFSRTEGVSFGITSIAFIFSTICFSYNDNN